MYISVIRSFKIIYLFEPYCSHTSFLQKYKLDSGVGDKKKNQYCLPRLPCLICPLCSSVEPALPFCICIRFIGLLKSHHLNLIGYQVHHQLFSSSEILFSMYYTLCFCYQHVLCFMSITHRRTLQLHGVILIGARAQYVSLQD